jgi:hypothetical protein
MMRHSALAALSLLAAACGDERTASPPAAADSARPAVIASDAPVTPPAPVDSTHLLSEHGLGVLRIGMTAAAAQAALGGDLQIEEPLSPEDGPEACRYARSGSVPGFVMFEGLEVVRIDADSTVSTAAGARIGQTEAEVLALYPGARVLPHHYVEGHYLVVIPGAPADTVHRLVFETDGQRVTALRGGVYPPVEYVEGCA